MKPRLSLLLSLGCCTIAQGIYLKPTSAQVAADGTTDTTVNSTNQTDFTITDGDRAGGNLFHSFDSFSVPNGGSAFFDNASDIANIFSRVTGGNMSNIDGLIRANGTANLFLINPAGIMFGRDARLDIGGSFLGTTADSILFEDGEFSATDLENPPLLTVNAPIGLGFRDNPGDIVNTSVGVNLDGETNVTGGAVGLQVPDGETLAIVGGNVLLDDGNLTAKGGHIEIGSVLGEGQVGITDTDIGFILDYDSIDSFGDITLQNTAFVDVTASGGGSINVNAENVSVNQSGFLAGIESTANSSDAQAGDITVKTNFLTLNNSADLRNSTAGIGNSGNIAVEARSQISLNDSSLIVTEVSDENEGATGNAGNIDLTTASLFLRNGSGILADTENQGQAGNIKIDASNSILLEGEGLARGGSNDLVPSQITSTVDPIELNVFGERGFVDITTGSLALKDGAFIRTSTLGRGDAGNLTITANAISLDGVDSDGFGSSIASEVRLAESEGNGGNIEIITNYLSATNGGQISVSTFGKGNGGNVKIKADEIFLDGLSSETDRSGIFNTVEPTAIGNGGQISIETETLSINNRALVNGSTFGQGNAGNILLQIGQSVSLDNSNIISSVRPGAVGDAGNITIQTEKLTLANGSQVQSAVVRPIDNNPGGVGNGGNLIINATESIDISGVFPERGFPSGLIALTEQGASGRAGNIEISTGSLRVVDAAAITVGTRNSSNGGSIVINANTLEANGGGQIRATTRDSGDAGNITLNIAEKITLSGSDPEFFVRREQLGINRVSEAGATSGIFVNASETSTGQAGFLQITTGELIVNDEARVDVSSLGEGNAGKLTIIAESINLNNRGNILASTRFGEGGNIGLQIADNLIMRDNSQISARATGEAVGGNIDIDADFVIAFPSQIPNNGNDILADGQNNESGNLFIEAEAVFGFEVGQESPGNGINDIDFFSDFEVPETETLQSTEITEPDFSQTQTVEPEQTVAQVCEADRENVARNGLIIKGKGDIPPEPTSPLDSDVILVQQQNSQAYYPDIKPIKTSIGDIMPARGIIKTESGEIILTAYLTDNIDRSAPTTKANCS